MPGLRSRSRSTLFAVFALLAMTAQLVVAMAPLGEIRIERSMSAHVEATGATGHYTHDDANCVSCQARTIHGTTAPLDHPLPVVALAYATPVDRMVFDRAFTYYTPDNPRAPPAVI